MNAVDAFLSGLIDYAGLYPPASLDMQSAVTNYLAYKHGKHAHLLGRFIVDGNRLSELREVAGDSVAELPLSVIAPSVEDWKNIAQAHGDKFRIEAVEIKPDGLHEISREAPNLPEITTYFEVPIASVTPEVLKSIRVAGARVKLRTGGVSAAVFPSLGEVQTALMAIANWGLAFKATAGLHHPIRGCHPFTYEPESSKGMMHGFLNLFLAATNIYFGGTEEQTEQILKEENPQAFHLTADMIGWRSLQWSTEHLRTVRREFAMSFGSCSFVEPIQDLETMGWL